MGLYRALAVGPATAEELAARTDCDVRYVTEWLRGQAAGGYAQCEPETETYWLSDEQAFALADPDGGIYVPGGLVAAVGALHAIDRITEGSLVRRWMGMNTTGTLWSARTCSSDRLI